jgi:hypothetical protein
MSAGADSDMEKYYYPYDVYVDEDGKILDLCSCGPEDDCFFKKQWMDDGSPTHVTEEMWNELDELDNFNNDETN